MPLENSLSASPYFDDYDRTKEFYRILFKPGVAVQTRELNQLQSIIQNQIEHFGDHVFKSGTIVSGVNFNYITKYDYVKILDTQVDGQPSLPASYVGFFVKDSLNLTARIVNSRDGLESRSPDLKALYLQYVNSSDADTSNGNAIYTTFAPGSQLTVFSKDYPVFKVDVQSGGLGFSNADTVVITSAITVSGNSVAFSNGETLTQATTGAQVVINSINTTAVANTIILSVKPRTVDLTNTSVNSAAWSLSTGYNIVGGSSGATANVISIIGSGATGIATTDTLGIIQSITVPEGGNGYSFTPHVTVKTSNTTATVNSLDLRAQNYKTVITAGNSSINTTGAGYAFGVSEGIIYQKGFFLRVDPQVIIVDPFTTTPNNITVGFKTEEQIVDAYEDESLYDNAANTTNYTAPGADRLKLVPVLTTKTISEAASNVEFFTLAEWKEGFPYKENRTTVYSNLADEMARRTLEAQGNFVVNSFQVFTKDKSTTNTTHISAVIDPGVAYISGYRVATSYNNYLDVERSTSFSNISNQTVTVNYGNYIKVNSLAGLFNFKAGDQISLRDTAKGYVDAVTVGSSGAITPAGNQIGTARIRSLILDGGTPGTPDCSYRLYLFDIQMNAGQTFRDVKSVYYDGTVHDGVADVVLTLDPTTSANIAVLNDIGADRMLFSLGKAGTRSVSNVVYTYRTVSDTTLQLTSGGQLTIGPLGSGLTHPYSDGALTSTQKKDFIIFPLANAQVSANLSGSVSLNSGNAEITGTSTTFASDLKVGDFVKVANATANVIVQVKNIANNTTLTLSNTAPATMSGNAVIFYPALYPLALETRADRSVTISSSSKTATLNINKTLASTVNAIAVYNIRSTDAQPVTKTVNRDVFVKISTSNNAATNQGPWALGLPGAIRLKNVYLGNSTVNTSSTDVTKHFVVDAGDDENAYRTSKLVLAQGSTLSINTTAFLLVKLDVFTTGGAEGFFTLSSYSVDDTANLASSTSTINTLEIPETVTRKGDYYDLRDTIDFRPYGSNTAAVSTTVGGATVNPASTFALSGDDQFFPLPDSTVTFTASYYNTRIDRIIVRKDSTFSVVKGTPSLSNPVAPATPSEAVTLALLYVPPYPSLPQVLNNVTLPFASRRIGNARGEISARQTLLGVRSVKQASAQTEQPRRYTMQDIGAIDRRLKEVEYTASLNQIETAIKDKIIPSGVNPTLDRFKHGFIVEPFDNYDRADTSHREYSASIDQERSFLKPPTRQLNFECDFDLTDTTTADAIVDDVLLLPFTEVAVIQQLVKTTAYTPLVQEVRFVGEGTVEPASFSIQSRGEVIRTTSIIEEPTPVVTAAAAAVTTVETPVISSVVTTTTNTPSYDGVGADVSPTTTTTTQDVVGLQDYGPGSPGDAGPSDCFTFDTIVTLQDDKKKPIGEVVIGDKVLNASGTGYNTVKYVERVADTHWELLYSPSASYQPFATINHPLIIGGVLHAPHPDQTFNDYPWLGRAEKIAVTSTAPASGHLVYNLWVDGDGTYTVNGYGTTSIVGDGGAVSRCFRRGLLTEEEVLQALSTFTRHGKYTSYGSYLINKLVGKVDINTVNKVLARALRNDTAREGLKVLANAVGRVAWIFK